MRSLLVLLAILAATFAVYAQVPQFGFVSWDDPLYVTANPQVRNGLSAEGALWALTARADSNWLPLTWLSHMLDVSLWGSWAGGHHLVNLLLHAIATALLFALLLAASAQRAEGERRPEGTRAVLASAFVAALFALHPLHVEVVAWISQRKELLSTAFGLLAAIAYVSWTRRGGAPRYAALVISFAAALAAKPMLVTLPFALLLLDYWPLARLGQGARRLLLEKLPLFALSAAVCAVAFVSQEIARAQAPDVPLALRLAHAAVVPFRYLELALWPSPLSVLYPHAYAPELGGEPWGAATVAAAAVALVVITVAAVAARRRPYLAVGWLWFLGTLVPVIGLVQVGPQGYADRYTYVPLIGPFIALAWGARDAIAARGAPLRAVAWVLAALVLFGLGTASHARARVWHDSESLYLASLAATPRNPVLLYNLGRLQAQQGRTEDAVRSYEAALAIDPQHPAANNNLGNIRLRAGDPERALAHYRAALRRTPDDAELLQNLGRVLAWRGELAEAVAHLEHAARVDPGRESIRRDLEAARAALQGNDPSPPASN